MEHIINIFNGMPVWLQGTLGSFVVSALISLISAKVINKKKLNVLAIKLSATHGKLTNFFLPKWFGPKNALKLENGMIDTIIEFGINYLTNYRKIIMGDNKK